MSTATDRRFVSQLGHNEQVSQVFLASDKQLRPNRNGNLYLQLQLSDRSGAIAARLWNASENDYRAFENGDYVRVDGNTQLFQGNMQLIASTIRRARPDEVDETDFLVAAVGRDRPAWPRGSTEILRTIKHARAAQPGRVLPDGRRVHGQVHRRPGRHEESSRLPGRPAGARRRPDGAGAASSPRATRSSTRTSCWSARSCTTRPRSTSSPTTATSPTPTKANCSATWCWR